MMKETPILFSDAMVRAILEGRKTQTRRVVNPQPLWVASPFIPFKTPDADPEGIIKNRYGEVGDRLWVREGVIQIGHERTGRNGQYLWPKWDNHEAGKTWLDSCCHYTTDITDQAEWDRITAEPCGRLNKMFMPRWASRITLQITGVKVERLHDIGKDGRKAENVLAEGIERHQIESMEKFFHPDDSPALAFSQLWTSINGKGSWALNPWVWAISFTRVPAEVVAGQKGKS